jgi:hypothetical protein
MNEKICTHFFHGLYLFDRDDAHIKYVNSSGPTHLLSDWPLFSRIPKAIKKDGVFIEYSDFKKYLELNDSAKNRPADSYCENFIKIKKEDFSKFHGLFHNLIKSLSVSHKIQYSLNGTSSGVKERTCCEKNSPAQITAKYDKNTGGHCCDAAVFGFYVSSKKIGTINLNNAGDCGSRSSGPFSMTQEDVNKRVVPIEITCELDGCHGGFTDAEIKGNNFTKSISLSEGKSCLEICVQPDDNFSPALCCCPPLHQKNSSSSSSEECPSYTKSIGYECSRSHSKKLDLNFEIDTNKIFNLSELNAWIDAHRVFIESKSEPIAKDINSINELGVISTIDNQPGFLNVGFSAFINKPSNDFKLYKDNWQFIGNSDYKSYIINNSINNYPLIKDPVLGYKDSTIGYHYTFTAPFKNDTTDFLKQSIQISSQSKSLASISINGENSNLQHHDIKDEWDIVDTLTYESSCLVDERFFSEKDNSYIFFIKLKGWLYPGDVKSLRWNAGDYEKADYKTGEGENEKKSESSSIEWDKGNVFNSIPTENSITIGTDPRDIFGENAFDEWSELKKNRQNWIEKFDIPLSINIGGSNYQNSIKCFRFKEQKSIHSPSSSSSSSSSCDLNKKVDCQWTQAFSLTLTSYSDKDFDNQKLLRKVK